MFPPLWAESQSATTPARWLADRGPIGDSSPATETFIPVLLFSYLAKGPKAFWDNPFLIVLTGFGA